MSYNEHLSFFEWEYYLFNKPWTKQIYYTLMMLYRHHRLQSVFEFGERQII